MTPIEPRDLARLGESGCRALLDDPVSWPALSDAALVKLSLVVMTELDLPAEDFGGRVLPLYRLAVDRLHPFERRYLYDSLRYRVNSGETSPDVLLPVMREETLGELVTDAVGPFVLNSAAEDGDRLAGARVVIGMFLRSEARERAWLFAGLLNLGDRKVVALLNELRDELDKREIVEVALNPSVGIHACVAEFWLGWLEAVAGDLDHPFSAVALGLAVLPDTRNADRVVDLVWSGSRPDSRPVRRSRKDWDFADFSRKLKPRIEAVATRLTEHDIGERLRAAWGLSSPVPTN
jgi:hypothetical protein